MRAMSRENSYNINIEKSWLVVIFSFSYFFKLIVVIITATARWISCICVCVWIYISIIIGKHYYSQFLRKKTDIFVNSTMEVAMVVHLALALFSFILSIVSRPIVSHFYLFLLSRWFSMNLVTNANHVLTNGETKKQRNKKQTNKTERWERDWVSSNKRKHQVFFFYICSSSCY